MDYVLPVHTTTRLKRNDDEVGFYNYISVDDFINKVNNNEFLFYSCYKERYYGILKKDFIDLYSNSNGLIINVNYMDLEQLSLIKEKYDMIIIQLTFNDLEKNIIERTCNRGQTEEDTRFRVEVALKNEELHQKQIKKYVDLVCYTDEMSFEEEVEYILKGIGKK